MMDKEQENQQDFMRLLKQNGLKVTPHRLRVLNEIMHKDAAVSQPDLEKLVGKDIDRVTLYRILASFEEKGIVHKIFDLHGTATYASCSEACSGDHHHDQHIHFMCSSCNAVYCLDEITLPKIPLPSNFTMESLAINAVGRCADCTKKEAQG